MNSDLITLNESQNDGTHIHLYCSDNVHMWIAYGYSAYALRLYVKSRRIDNLRDFSYKMQMPCTVVSNDCVEKMRKTLKIEKETIDEYLELSIPEAFNMSDYLAWVAKLREVRMSTEGMGLPYIRFCPESYFRRARIHWASSSYWITATT